jgi:phage tail sheath gpL-like
VRVGGHVVEAAVSAEDDAEDVADALEAACGGKLPATALAAAAVVTFTARHKGVNGNAIRLEVDVSSCPGITVADSDAALEGGLGNLDLESLLVAIASTRFHKIVLSEASETPFGDLVEHCDVNADAVEQRGQQCIVAMTGDLSDATTLATTENGARGQVVLLAGSQSLPWEVAAAVGAARALRCGSDPAVNLDGTVLLGLLPPDEGQALTRAEIETCLKNGVTPLEEVSGAKVALVRSITTYVQDADGEADTTLLETATIDTMDYTRDACRTATWRIHQGKKITAQRPAQVRSTLLQVLGQLEQLEILRDVESHVDQVVVQAHPTDVNRLDCVIPAEVVPGLHVLAARFDLYLS